MPTFEVTIPISSLHYDEHPSLLAILPERFELNHLRVERPAGSVNAQTMYRCTGLVTGPDEAAATTEVLQRANEVLWAMATWNGSYRADVSGAVAREVAAELKKPTSGSVTRTRSVPVRAVIAEQRDLQLEAVAFSWRPRWPSWLRTALELNYLAVTTRDIRPALVIHWSILEIVADEHEPATTLLSALDPSARQGLLRAVRDAAAIVLKDPSIERLLARLKDTQAESVVARIHAALRRFEVDAPLSAIDRVRKARGTIAHGATAGHEYQEAEGEARTWVQSVLRSAVESHGQLPPAR